ncbi:MAG TPA: hypothetical protein VK756_03485 [Solirubrobacteraceae bacterium]|jgi:tRNA nucleotidyltransferase (CCA-adding enzyme)|nr:hypothetical protein [Solirubrobacteraceae bacterium]
MRSPDRKPRELLARLAEQPGGARLLALAGPETYLVGGAVRDLMLGRVPRELDVVVEGEDAARALVAELAAAAAGGAGDGAVGPRPVEHPRFGTARVELPGGARVDVAQARRERYPAPGALPEVEPARLEEDLLRRDFTVNTLALALAPNAAGGALRAAAHALQDLREGRLRVLHERSFIDDPTRLWRLARYRARLDFAIEERTAQLAHAAVAAGALATVSGARVGAELRLALAEPDALAALAELERLGVLRALHPRLRLDHEVVERALELLAGGRAVAVQDAGAPGAGDRPDLLMLAGIALPLALSGVLGGDTAACTAADGDARSEIAAFLDRLEFTAADRDRVVSAAAAVPGLIDELPGAVRASQLREVAVRVPPEGVALAGALSVPAATPARRWLCELRHVRLSIGGKDLLAAGVPEGPELGRRLERALRMRLDGALADGPEAELAVALEDPLGA